MAEEDVKRADFDRENKLKESKVVAKAARIKRAELNDLERLLARSVAFSAERHQRHVGLITSATKTYREAVKPAKFNNPERLVAQ